MCVIVCVGLYTSTNKLISANDQFDCLKKACNGLQWMFHLNITQPCQSKENTGHLYATHSNDCWLT